MTTIGPIGPIAAGTVAAAAAVRPVVSSTTRIIAAAGVGFAAFAGIGLWADNHFDRMPDANGESAGYIDRYEARDAFSGTNGFPAIVSFTALLSASLLYSHAKHNLSPTEFSFLRHIGYGVMGGGLIGTSIAPSLLRRLPDKSAWMAQQRAAAQVAAPAQAVQQPMPQFVVPMPQSVRPMPVPMSAPMYGNDPAAAMAYGVAPRYYG